MPVHLAAIGVRGLPSDPFPTPFALVTVLGLLMPAGRRELGTDWGTRVPSSLHTAGPGGSCLRAGRPLAPRAASSGRLIFWNGKLELKGPEAASSVGGSALSFYFPPRPYLPKQTARASHPLHPRPRDRKQAVTATRPRLPCGPRRGQASNPAKRRSDWLRPAKRRGARPIRARAGRPPRESSPPGGRGERGFTCLWYLLRGA